MRVGTGTWGQWEVVGGEASGLRSIPVWGELVALEGGPVCRPCSYSVLSRKTQETPWKGGLILLFCTSYYPFQSMVGGLLMGKPQGKKMRGISSVSGEQGIVLRAGPVPGTGGPSFGA